MTKIGVIAALCATMVGVTPGSAGQSSPAPSPPAVVPAAASPGAPGIGDPYYPLYGNGGYDVGHYDINVWYTPKTDWLAGTTTITAKATMALSRFNLDFALPVTAVTVNGVSASFTKPNWHELQVTPHASLASGTAMTVVVSYAGAPSSVRATGPVSFDPWTRTKDGVVAVGEPEIAAWWYPSNDHPRDKATFDITMHVPHGLEAVSNGVLRSKSYGRLWDEWSWRTSQPMTTYLAFMAIGQFDIATWTSPKGLFVFNAVASAGGREAKAAKRDLGRTPEIVSFFESQFGPYPFDAMGGVAPAADLAFALENQTRPVYSRGFWSSGESAIYVVVHELAHMWYGDSVSLKNWRDVWLNEGFATFAEFLWSERKEGYSADSTLEEIYRGVPASSEFWQLKIGDPGAGSEFDWAVYLRGGMTLQALRRVMGDRPFFALMRTWATTRAGGNGQIQDFTTLAEKISGKDLGGFFRAWLYTTSKPAATWANGLDPAWGKAAPRTTDQRALDDRLARMRAAYDAETAARRSSSS